MDTIEIFRTGTHTDSSGKSREWTDKDLAEIASLYNPASHEAPIVIGHPEHDSPAYGWVESLKVDGGKLLAQVKDVAAEFKDWVRRGLYKKVSIALYPDLTLRHVGFLGATPPAVKGLKQAAFGDKKSAWEIETDFQYMDYWQQDTVKTIFQRMRDWMIDKFSLEEADRIISTYDIEALKPEPPKETVAVTQSFSAKGGSASGGSSDTDNKGGKKMDIKKLLSDLSALIVGAQKDLVPDSGGAKFTEADLQAKVKEAREAAFTEAQKKTEEEKTKKEAALKRLAEIETKARRDEVHGFCESLAKEGKLIPAWQKMGIGEFILSLDSGGNMKFAEGQEKPQSQWFMDFIKELPKVVIFREVTPPDDMAGGNAGEKLGALTKKKMEEKKLSYGAAFAEAQKENPELAIEVAEAIRVGRVRK